MPPETNATVSVEQVGGIDAVKLTINGTEHFMTFPEAQQLSRALESMAQLVVARAVNRSERKHSARSEI